MPWTFLPWFTPAPNAPAPDLFAQVQAFKLALAEAAASLPPIVAPQMWPELIIFSGLVGHRWVAELSPVVAENEAGELCMFAEGIILRRGKREIAVALSRCLSPLARSLN